MGKSDYSIFHGARLRLARTFCGLTLAELGEAVSATRQYMQKIETNTNVSPSTDMIMALAEVLDVKPTFFYQPLTYEVKEDECFFRKLKTTPQHIKNRALSYGTIFNLIVSRLEEDLDLPPLDIPDLSAHDNEGIEKAAEKCRIRWHLHLDAPIKNMTRVIENAGVIVTTFEGVSTKIDAFSFWGKRPIVVRSIEKASPSRARFDLAHELGHLVLHNGLTPGDPELEDQANHFASAFLLPRVAFVREFSVAKRLNWNEILSLKIRWGVSMQAIIRRAYDLRLITAVQYRNAQIYFSRTKQRIHERGEDDIKDEAPEVIKNGLKILQNELGIDRLEFSKSIDLKPDIFNKFSIKLEVNQKNKSRDNIIYFVDKKKNA